MNDEIIKYQHTQTGHLIIFVIIAITFLFGFILTQSGYDYGILAIMIVIISILASFSSLKVVINEEHLRVQFGYGIFIKNFLLNEMGSAKSVRNHWYYGWGIRIWFWPYMIIYNVSGFDAVEIRMKNGKIFRIGTDDPQGLEFAINNEIKL